MPFYTQPTAQGLHCRMLPVIPLLPCCDGRDEGVAFASRLFMRRLIGSWSSPNLSKFSPMGHACVHRLHNATIRRASAQNASFRVRMWFLEYERCCPKFWQWFSTFLRTAREGVIPKTSRQHSSYPKLHVKQVGVKLAANSGERHKI